MGNKKRSPQRAVCIYPNEKTVVQGMRLPTEHGLTCHEREWISMIRIITNDTDPSVSLRAVQALRRELKPE